MDTFDKQILDIIQTNYPIVSRPYAHIGHELGLSESETYQRVRAMQDRGIIRRIGANFQSRKLGWKSTLCAASVPEQSLDDFVAVVNEYPGVTHNYLRRHTYNIWFTYIGPSWEKINADLHDISERTGVKILNLPAEQTFKIRVDFRMSEDLEEDPMNNG